MLDSKTNQTQINNSLNVLQRIATNDRTAIADCLDKYGSFIWSLAQKYTDSAEKAEAVTQEIFMDIWRHVERTNKSNLSENLKILLIARRRLIRNKQS